MQAAAAEDHLAAARLIEQASHLLNRTKPPTSMRRFDTRGMGSIYTGNATLGRANGDPPPTASRSIKEGRSDRRRNARIEHRSRHRRVDRARGRHPLPDAAHTITYAAAKALGL